MGIARRLFDSAGNAGPTIWVDGRIVGGWAQRRDGEIAPHLLEDVGKETRHAIERGGRPPGRVDRSGPASGAMFPDAARNSIRS